MTASIPLKIKNEYYILPLALPATPSGAPEATHILYLRRHQPRIPTPNDSRTLFVSNLPADATDAHLRTLLSSLGGGRIESVSFSTDAAAPPPPAPAAPTTIDSSTKKRKRAITSGGGEAAALAAAAEIRTWDRALQRSGANGLAVFVDDASCAGALRAIEKLRRKSKTAAALPVWGEGVAGVPELGIARYAAHHRLRFPASARLQASADAFVAAFGEAEEVAKQQAAKRRSVVDEDGFVTVTRGGRVKPATQEAAKAVLDEKEKRKGELKGFYRFQIREEKKTRQNELLAKFEEDRKRVEERKKGRKFRP
ncbi:ribosomal RNA-processing protein 7-domain-containing protein, partial [Tricharina praecox]|uniref:ribosomal RNA-processing protein 7-domain-containing protein n=1 Tax=Tricharina praecox TaxID=43433 RepID=UPI00221E621B